MAGDKVPSIHALEKPENFQEMLRKDRQEDCMSCKVVGTQQPFPLGHERGDRRALTNIMVF